METMLQGLVIVGGLTFSLAAALLIEELIFGRIFRVVFARRAEAPDPGHKQER
jgi:hypothetical protein